MSTAIINCDAGTALLGNFFGASVINRIIRRIIRLATDSQDWTSLKGSRGFRGKACGLGT